MILFIFEFLYLAYIHTWEVDAHHDGIMYTAAVGVYEAKIPNRDFFAQYGPISPILQGLWFRVTEPTLWSLKLLTSIGLALIGLLIYIGVKRRFSRMTASLLSICWVLTGPFGLPWSSVFSTIFILSSLLIMESIVSSDKEKNFGIATFTIGSLLAISTYTRIHSIVVFFAIILGFIIIKNRIKYFRLIIMLTTGFISTFSVLTILLAGNKAFTPYLDQCILWASSAYGGGPQISLSYFMNLAWIPIFGIFNLLIIWQIFKSRTLKSVRTYLTVFMIIGVYFLLFISSQLSRSEPQTLRNPRILAVIGGEKSHFAFNFTIISFFLILIVLGLINLKKARSEKGGIGNSTIYFLIALATSTQLYPYTDEYHIAFVAPVILVACAFIVPEEFRERQRESALQLWCLALIPTLVLTFIVNASVERIGFESKTLKGMHGSWITTKALDQTMRALEGEEPGVKFNCADGIYAGAGGRYLAADEKFVTWGPPAKSISYFDREFVCHADDKVMDSYLELGWQVKFKVQYCPMTGCSEINYWNVLFERK